MLMWQPNQGKDINPGACIRKDVRKSKSLWVSRENIIIDTVLSVL